jgi:hypothetical protein
VTEREIRRELREKLTPRPAETRPWYRAAGDCVCEACGHPYRLHPPDSDQPDYSGQNFLRVLCNGDRVHL